MTQHEILHGVTKVAKEHLGVEQPMSLTTDLFADLQLDSLKQLTLIVELENHFKVCFEEGDEFGLSTLGDLVTLIGKRLKAQKAKLAP